MLLILVLGIVILPSLVTACAEPEQIEVTRIVTEEVEKIVEVEVEVTRVVTEIEEVEVEVTRVVPLEMDELSFVSLSSLAKRIRDGEIDVGDEFGMGEEQRFHVIHTDVIDMKCLQCHVEEAPLEVAQPLNITDDAPGIVDRRVCLGCHLNGPAGKLYEPKE
jgi:hypothetical protein